MIFQKNPPAWSGRRARVGGLAVLAPWLAVAISTATGCAPAAESCVLGTESCACTSVGACDPGLSCQAGSCLQATDPPPADPGAGPTSLNPIAPRPDASATAMMPITATSGPAPPQGVLPIRRDAGGPPPNVVDAGVVNLAGPTALGPQVPGGSGPTWTILVYGHGDHNLSPTLLRDFQEMNRAELSPSVRVIFLSDWNSSVKIPGSTEYFPSGTFWYRIVGRSSKPELVGTEGELDLDDPAVMAKVIEVAYRRYPADRYGLILWDHGGAWLDGFGSDSQNGTVRGPGMSLNTIRSAVERGLAAAGLTGPRPLEFLGFDTCLMAGAEVISAFQQTSKVYIANAELDYGAGLDYETTFTWLSRNPGASPAELAAAEATAWDEHHRTATPADQLFRSHAAFDTQKFAAFETSAKGLVAAVQTAGLTHFVRGVYGSVPGYFSGEVARQTPRPKLRDFGTILDRLAASTDPGVAAAAVRTRDAGRAARIAGASGMLRQNQLGMHVFGGPIYQLLDTHLQLYPQYADAWNRATGWSALLSSAKAAIPSVKPTLTGTPVVPATPTLQDPPVIQFQVGGQDIGGVDAALMQVNPDDMMQLIVNGVFASDFIQAGSHELEWLGSRQVLDARPPIVVTAQPWQYTLQGSKVALAMLAVPGLLVYGEDQQKVSMIASADGVASAVVLEESISVSSFADIVESLGAEVMFVPLMRIFDSRTMEFLDVPAKQGVFLPQTSSLRVVNQPVPPGVYGIMIQVDDIWGNIALQIHAIQLARSIQ